MLEHQGKLYARVSEIIQPFTNFGGIAEDVLKRKASIGTAVHHAIKQEIDGELATPQGQEVGYFQSFEKWRCQIKPSFIESEMRYYCDQKHITGCIDALVKFQGEEDGVLVDFKTSAQESPITWPMQAHLYGYLLKVSGKQISNRYLFLKLDRNGGFPTVFQYKFESNLLMKCFQAIDEFWKKNSVADK